MNATLPLLVLLVLTAGGCTTTAPAPPRHSAAEAQIAALHQERQQLLATLGEFHDRNRELENKLADHGGTPAAQSYDQLLAVKEAELTDLRKTTAESNKVAAQLHSTTNDLNQAKLRIAGLEQQLSKKDQDLASLQGIATAAADLETATHRINELQSLLAQREQETRSLRTSSVERESLVAQVQTATTTLNQTKERLASIEKQFLQKDTELRAAKADKQKLSADLIAYSNELRQTRQRVALLEQQATDREQKLNVARKEVSDRDRLVNDLAVANMDVTQTKQRASNLERQLAAISLEQTSPQAVKGSEGELSASPPSENARAGVSSGGNLSAISNQDSRPSLKRGDLKARTGPSPKQTLPSQPIVKHTDQSDPELLNASEHLASLLKNEVSRGNISLKQYSNKLALGLSSSFLFQSGDATLTPDGMNVLKRIGTVLGQVPNNDIQVVGHTDSHAIRQELRRTFPNNKALSSARAENARRGLINGGLPVERVRAIGMADKIPLVSNATEAGRQKNRRIEIVVTHLTSSTQAMKVGNERDTELSMAALAASEKQGTH